MNMLMRQLSARSDETKCVIRTKSKQNNVEQIFICVFVLLCVHIHPCSSTLTIIRYLHEDDRTQTKEIGDLSVPKRKRLSKSLGWKDDSSW